MGGLSNGTIPDPTATLNPQTGVENSPFTSYSRSWFGRVFRHNTLPKIILQEIVDGWRRRGRPRKPWKDNIKEWTGIAAHRRTTEVNRQPVPYEHLNNAWASRELVSSVRWEICVITDMDAKGFRIRKANLDSNFWVQK